MKRRLLVAAVLVGLLMGITPVGRANVLNDGSSTDNLQRMANPEETTFGSTTILTVDAGADYLVAEQIDSFLTPYPELRTVWYARNATATGLVYRVSADFRPAVAQVRRQGGVMGWLNENSLNGLLFKVMPASGGAGLPASFQVAHVDFTAMTPEENENLRHLYNLDGTPATADLESAWSAVGEGYQASEFVRLELSFSEPTPADLEVVTDAVVTARVTARAWQVSDVGGAEEQLGRTIELLTTLPEPGPDHHRMGYFGVWASGLFPGGVIGHYRNLEAEGAVAIHVNLPPEVTLTAPAAGSRFDEPATIIMEAHATDPDGTVVQVEFFEGTNRLGVVTTAPFTFQWTGVRAGDYTLRAVAMDDQGATATSEPVSIHVVPWTGTLPTLTVEGRIDGSIVLSWEGTGFQLQYKRNLADLLWTDVPDTVNVNRVMVPVELGAGYFRLVGSAMPDGPVLSVERMGENLVITWPAELVGYQLQSTDSLANPIWIGIETSDNQHVTPMTGPGRFYRLLNP